MSGPGSSLDPEGSPGSSIEPEGSPTASRPMSYTERYRAAEPPPPAPPPAPGNRSGRLVAMVGVALVVVTVGAIAALLAFRGAPPGPAAAATVPPPSPTITPPATPVPTLDPGEAARQRFWTVIRNANLSYHVETRGHGLVGGVGYTFSESYDVQGDDYRGTLATHGVGGAKVQLVVLDTVVWIKSGDTAWTKGHSSDPYLRARPFLDLDTLTALDYVGTVDQNGVTTYDLRSNTNYQPHVGKLVGLQSMPAHADEVMLDVFVTADGIPVSSTVTVKAGGIGSDGKPVFEGGSTRTYTKVGATFDIVAPKP